MGLINKIRERSGLAVGIIATGLILFLVGGDLLSVNSILLGGDRGTLGEIVGEEVTLEEFQALLEQNVQQYRLNTKQEISSSTMSSLRDQTWQQFIERIAHQKQYEELGLEVSEAELIDMVQGDHIKEDLKQSFRNKETGKFEKEKLQEYLQNISQFPAEQQFLWYKYEQSLTPRRLGEKYNSLLSKSTYVTQAEAEEANKEQNKRISIRYFYAPYGNLPDSGFSVSEEEAHDYLEAHEADYQRERSRKLFYVGFPIVPSADDTAYVREGAYMLFEELSKSEQDSLFATANTDGDTPYTSYGPDELPEDLSSRVDSLLPGQTVGPLLRSGKYVMYKVSEISPGETEYMRASHILIKPESETEENKSKARKEANDLLRKIQGGESFEELAKIHGTDGTAASGGDLGWFSRGRMVADFESASFGATKKGLLPKVTETQFGFHLIKVTELPTNQQFIVSTIEKEIDAREETRDKAYQKAVEFVTSVEDTASFLSVADTMNLFVVRATDVKPSDTRVEALSEARTIVQWLYNSADLDDISEVFELENEFVVGVMAGEQPEGLANYEDVAEELKEKVMQQKKASAAIEKLKLKTGTPDELVKLFPSGTAYVYSASGLRFSDTFCAT